MPRQAANPSKLRLFAEYPSDEEIARRTPWKAGYIQSLRSGNNIMRPLTLETLKRCFPRHPELFDEVEEWEDER